MSCIKFIVIIEIIITRGDTKMYCKLDYDPDVVIGTI